MVPEWIFLLMRKPVHEGVVFLVGFREINDVLNALAYPMEIGDMRIHALNCDCCDLSVGHCWDNRLGSRQQDGDIWKSDSGILVHHGTASFRP